MIQSVATLRHHFTRKDIIHVVYNILPFLQFILAIITIWYRKLWNNHLFFLQCSVLRKILTEEYQMIFNLFYYDRTVTICISVRKLCRFIFWQCVVINRIFNKLSLHLRVLFDHWICFIFNGNKFVYILTEQYEHVFLNFNDISLFYGHKW